MQKHCSKCHDTITSPKHKSNPLISQKTGGLLCMRCFREEKIVLKRNKIGGSSSSLLQLQPESHSITLIETEYNTPIGQVS